MDSWEYPTALCVPGLSYVFRNLLFWSTVLRVYCPTTPEESVRTLRTEVRTESLTIS
jgi:hypothetical protein